MLTDKANPEREPAAPAEENFVVKESPRMVIIAIICPEEDGLVAANDHALSIRTHKRATRQESSPTTPNSRGVVCKISRT
ncbi:hypothetical protein [Desulfonatronum thioautotrophicum]|uniref:hypothetical protein n=1 Tax=Desulfonatronum thioautotrophicum TaxID=617001 RepID=UPI0013792A21|nr:hypothetical protein [Desulfonatronum thioautotrophicum]